MIKLPTKTADTLVKASDDWALPRITLPHASVKAAKSHQVGGTHTLAVRAKKVSQTEDSSTYKITHIGMPSSSKSKPSKKRSYLLAKGKTSNGFGSMENDGNPF